MKSILIPALAAAMLFPSRAAAQPGRWSVTTTAPTPHAQLALRSVNGDTLFVVRDSASIAIAIEKIREIRYERPDIAGLGAAIGGGFGLILGLIQMEIGGGGHPDLSSLAPIGGTLAFGLIGLAFGGLASVDDVYPLSKYPLDARIVEIDSIIARDARR